MSRLPCQGEIQVTIPARDNKARRTAVLEVRLSDFVMNRLSITLKVKQENLLI